MNRVTVVISIGLNAQLEASQPAGFSKQQWIDRLLKAGLRVELRKLKRDELIAS